MAGRGGDTRRGRHRLVRFLVHLEQGANPDLALKWADYMIGPEGQMGVIENLNYSITNKEVVETLPMELREQLRMVDVPAEYAKIHMWKFVPNYDKWVQVWQEATAS